MGGLGGPRAQFFGRLIEWHDQQSTRTAVQNQTISLEPEIRDAGLEMNPPPVEASQNIIKFAATKENMSENIGRYK